MFIKFHFPLSDNAYSFLSNNQLLASCQLAELALR